MLWLIGSPLRGAPPNRLVQRAASLMYRPFSDAGYTVWAVGRRRAMPQGHTFLDMADDVAALIEDEFGGVVDVVVGESFGGMIGQYLAARHPDRFRHLALIVAGCELSPWSEEIDRRFIAALRARDAAETGAIWLEYFWPRGRKLTRSLLGPAMWRLLGLDGVPVGDLIVETEAGLAFDSRVILPEITVPVLLIAGDRDQFFPRSVIEETAALIPNCTLIVHEDQGHMEVASDPRTAREVLRWASTPISSSVA
jgi:pimeloyl-ACP methyl ester carboxylesterase